LSLESLKIPLHWFQVLSMKMALSMGLSEGCGRLLEPEQGASCCDTNSSTEIASFPGKTNTICGNSQNGPKLRLGKYIIEVLNNFIERLLCMVLRKLWILIPQLLYSSIKKPPDNCTKNCATYSLPCLPDFDQ
jgi:hypothetical protein